MYRTNGFEVPWWDTVCQSLVRPRNFKTLEYQLRLISKAGNLFIAILWGTPTVKQTRVAGPPLRVDYIIYVCCWPVITACLPQALVPWFCCSLIGWSQLPSLRSSMLIVFNKPKGFWSSLVTPRRLKRTIFPFVHTVSVQLSYLLNITWW